MLFVNFLCLLYLMLLVNGLTVSKNIDNSYFDERVDSLHDSEYTTRHKSKHDKFLHKHRRIKSGVITAPTKGTIKVTTSEVKSTISTLRPQHIKIHKSTKRRIGGFWRKFKIKEDKALQREKRLKDTLQNVNYIYGKPLHGNDYKSDDKRLVTKRRKNTLTFSFEKKKRESTNKVTKRQYKKKYEKEKIIKKVEVNITPYDKFTNAVKPTTQMKVIPNDAELKKMITTMTTKVTELKKLYGLENYKPSFTSTHKIIHKTKHTTTPTSTEDFDIPGTAQIEALLNDIKEKALHLIVEQNPDITDLITNTATEATFEVDPLLTHLEINSPAYSLYTFITLNSEFEKRNANITIPNNEKNWIDVEETSNSYNRKGRTVAEDAITAAQSIEDILQKEMKNIYKKVKNKVSGDFHKEIEKVKTTLSPDCKKKCNKEPPAKQQDSTKHRPKTSKKCKSTSHLQQNRVDRKSGKCTKVTERELTTTPTADDYVLLTLYEQMLTKTCQNNVMNMVTVRDGIIRKKRNKQLVSNRNFETLFDQNLKDNVKKIYEDREEIPDDLEYNFEVNMPEMNSETALETEYPSTSDNEEERKIEMDDNVRTEIPAYDDNSYEGLTSKISYNEYVNGYKHYLNFQKELANDKFSNLVRYQAHRHHNVDDIGKYILSKIPQLPSRDKRFLEYEDDRDSSTKSEESWFKKHFYMFIDNGTPKKYHTSQTISLKSPTSDGYDSSLHKTEALERSEAEDRSKQVAESEENVADINLEKLSQVLEEHKATPGILPVQESALKDSKNTGKRHGHIFKALTPPHIIEKVFGKNRNSNFNNYKDRKKRNTNNPKERSTTFGEKLIFQTKKTAKLINSTQTKKKSNNAKVGCVDVNLVVPPTAVVKLKDTKRKEGKLWKLLHKLHLSRSSKQKIKREYQNSVYTRKQRSNPFQKLKNIFRSTPKGKVLKGGSHLSDYDIMSSHIDTFKPVKFDKILSIEEMKKQIPNITGDVSASATLKFAESESSWNSHTTEKGFTDFSVLLNTTLPSLPMIPASNSPKLIDESNSYPTTKTTKKTKTQNIEDLFREDLETKSPYGYNKIIISSPHHMALNDIKDQVENIINNINSEDSNKIYSTESITNSKFLVNSKMPVGKITLKSNFNSFYTKIPCVNKYSKANLKIRPNSEKHTILDLEQNSEFVDDNSYLKTLKPDINIKELMTRQSPAVTVMPTKSLLSFSHSSNVEGKGNYKPYPDYFSDLLMWNKDLLNSDRVPTPWRDILRNMNHEVDSSTYVNNLQQELLKINDGLNFNVHSLKEPPTDNYHHVGITPRNWLQNMVIEKPPLSKSILIEQEKKYVKFDPKITDRHLKAADFVNELNKFAKTLSDDTKHNLNIIHNAQEPYFENKDQSVILVDTTLLAYDDDVNYISTLTPRELSKNALKIANLSHVAASLKAKSNKQPLQYFATPLPMKMTDFEDFLKANRLDVESVTSPNVDLPTISAYSSKDQPKTITMKKIATTVTKRKQNAGKAKPSNHKSQEQRDTKTIPFTILNDDDNEKESDIRFDYLDDLERYIFKDYYNSDEKERFKRYDDLLYDGYLRKSLADTLKEHKGYKEMKRHKTANEKLSKNTENDLKIGDTPETTEYITPKDFEITIINFGDINKLTDEYAPLKNESTSKKFTEYTEAILDNAHKTPLNVDFIEKGSKDSEFLHKLHNDLFYDHTFTKCKETITEPTETTKIEDTTMLSPPPLEFHESLLKKLPIKTYHEPKRVRISSQSYKYDIIYHHPEKNEKDRGIHHIPSYVTTTAATPPKELLSSYNSDFPGARESDVARGDCCKPRIVRKVKARGVTSTSKAQKSSTSHSKTKSKQRFHRHKLKGLFPVIQGKFKKFSKNSSNFSSSDFLQKSSTIILSGTIVNSKEKSINTESPLRTKTGSTCAEKNVTELLNKYNATVSRIQMKRVASKSPDSKLSKIISTIPLMTKASTKENKNDYDEQGSYEEQGYINFEVSDSPISTEPKICDATTINIIKDYINKREIQGLETYTAKDVAALEVIVDMVKNPLENEANKRHFTTETCNNTHSYDKINANTNSIQVHIAVPYGGESNKKRSLEPIQVRKVFTAKLSTPVDLEYQVHSFEGPPTTQKPVANVEGLSPGVYLLVGNTYFPQGVALKPMKVRQVKSTTEKFTSTNPTKKLAKVTLSKDFISAINKQLVLLYNLTTLDKNNSDVDNPKSDRIKRSINWDFVNKILGHDRVCHCKCKVNKTLCRACAASDAVMSELIFEFENLSKYMTDHCTEIQTYFWMNPSGGKRLKDSVHKIDQSLHDYYKRVRGKCQGRTCKTFATFIDKREFHKNHKRSKDAGHNFINDLELLAKDIEKATKTVTCFKQNIDSEIKKLKHIIDNCIIVKPHDKRSDFKYGQDSDVKNVYSLDKINVNIICNTEPTYTYITSMTAHNHDKNIWLDTEEKDQKPKGIRGLFSCFRKKKKDKLAEYLKQTNKSFFKRDVNGNQIETPLIADTGGSFWNDYIRKSSSEPRFARGYKPKIVVESKHNIGLTNKKDVHIEYTKQELDINSASATEAYSTNTSSNNSSGSTEFLNNINQFLKTFGVVDGHQIAEFKENLPPHNKTTTHKIKTKKYKNKKIKGKIHQTIKTKMKNSNSTNTPKIPNNSTELLYKENVEATTPNGRVTKTLNIFKSIFKTSKQTTTKATMTTKASFFKKIKMITTDFFKNLSHTNIISSSTIAMKREHNGNSSPSKCNNKLTVISNPTDMKNVQSDLHVISNITTEMYPNIIIIDDTDEARPSGYKDLLLSIIDYESNKLNEEWMKFANINLDKIETRKTKTKATKKSKSSTKVKDTAVKYDTLHDVEPLLPAKSNEIETTISISALLDKIGHKFKIKIVNNEAAARKKSVRTRAFSTKKMKKHYVVKEAVDSTVVPRICDIKATRQHILNIREEMPIKYFEEYVANVTCQKYGPAPKTLFLDKTRNQGHGNVRKWSWIRDRRSIFRLKSKPKANIWTTLLMPSLEFEVFYLGEHGIYKQKLRRKRCTNTDDFINELKDLPRLYDSVNEIHVLAGDSINISCFENSRHISDRFAWKAERDDMLNYGNVVVDGDVVHIAGVQAKNAGYYICKRNGLINRKIKLYVLRLPNFILLCSLLYAKETGCTHDDLKTFKLLGSEISKKVFQSQCSAKIANPVCIQDKTDGDIKVKAIGIVNCRRPAVKCCVSCRRDLQAAFASMCAENIAAVASIEVVLLDNGVNSTWKPSKYHRNSSVIRTLKDFNGAIINHKYPMELAHGRLHLRISCPAGYRLLLRLKVCAPCPVNTYAREGDNTCMVCPRGLRSTPGAERCRHAISRPRRYDWWICPPCGYGVAIVVALCCCGVCVALAVLVQLTSRTCGTTDAYNAKDSSEVPGKGGGRMNPAPTRSSRVILARFFKPSLTSSMATDSQETKFNMWKARNVPPPLPPVDFDT